MLTAASAGIMFWLMRLSHLRSSAQFMLMLAGLLAAALACRSSALQRMLGRHAAVGEAAYGFATFVAMALIGAGASYPLAAISTGYVDLDLRWSDELMKFDWEVLYEFVVRHPSLQMLGTLAYRAIYLTPAILIACWARAGQARRIDRFLLEFWCCAVVTLMLFPMMPAAGPLAYLWQGPIPYMPDSALCQPDLIASLRLEQMRTVNLANLCGLVSAPSFHAIAAVLYFRSAFLVGRWKLPVIVLASAMLLATPVEGTHYLTDILLGILVAVSVLVGVELIARWSAAIRST